MPGRSIPAEVKTRALVLLNEGRDLDVVAASINVHPTTVRRWINFNDEFRRALERSRDDLSSKERRKLRSLVPKAIKILEEELDDETNLKIRHSAALTVLRATGLYRAAPATDKEEQGWNWYLDQLVGDGGEQALAPVKEAGST